MVILYRPADKPRICFQLIDTRMTRDAWAEICEVLGAAADKAWHMMVTVGDVECHKVIHLRRDGCRYAEEWARLCSELRQDPESCEEMDVAVGSYYIFPANGARKMPT